MTYRPQANGTAERMVQTLIRAINMNVADMDKNDWDEYAERLTFVINTTQDRVRGDTPLYLIYGWDPRLTLEATLHWEAPRHGIWIQGKGDATFSVSISELEQR